MHHILNRVVISSQITDVELLKAVHCHPYNGSYACKICKNCGHFWTSGEWPQGKKPVILKQCKECPRTNEFVLLKGVEKFEKLQEMALTDQ